MAVHPGKGSVVNIFSPKKHRYLEMGNENIDFVLQRSMHICILGM